MLKILYKMKKRLDGLVKRSERKFGILERTYSNREAFEKHSRLWEWNWKPVLYSHAGGGGYIPPWWARLWWRYTWGITMALQKRAFPCKPGVGGEDCGI